MSKLLLIDTREHPKAIQGIIKTLDEARIPHVSTKLFIGDYMDFNRPQIIVDRKRNIAELAKNCTSDHERFRRELERAQKANTTLVVLVEQNRYKDRDSWIHCEIIEDLMLWESPHTTIRGEKIYRVLRSWMSKYPLRVEFCDKRQTGRYIYEIIYEGK
jgi:hypothetical protein